MEVACAASSSGRSFPIRSAQSTQAPPAIHITERTSHSPNKPRSMFIVSLVSSTVAQRFDLRFLLSFPSDLSIKTSIFFPPFTGIIFALVALFRLCPSYCLNLFSCLSYDHTPYLKQPMLAVGSVCPTLRHVAGAL